MPALINAGPSARGWHRLATFSECPRKFAFLYQAGQKFPRNDAQTRGSILHVGLAHHYVGMLPNYLGPEMYSPTDAMARVTSEFDASADLLEECLSVFGKYLTHYGDEDLQPLYVEEQFENIVAGHRLTSRLDLVAKDRAGRIWIVDHKTTSARKLDREFFNRYTLSGQFLAAQLLGVKNWGDKFAGVKINAIGVIPPYRFLRMNIDPAPGALRSFPRTVDYLEEGIRVLEGNKDPFSFPIAASEMSCSRCEARELCRFGGVK